MLAQDYSPAVTQDLEADLCWMHERDLRVGDRYLLRVGEPLAPFPSEDAAADSAAVNAAIEAMVRQAPSQYLGLHRRFKRQPDGRSRYG